MPTPTKKLGIDVKYRIWEVRILVRYYPTYAIARVPVAHSTREEGDTYRMLPRKVTGTDYDTLLSLKYGSEIANFFGYRSCC